MERAEGLSRVRPVLRHAAGEGLQLLRSLFGLHGIIENAAAQLRHLPRHGLLLGKQRAQPLLFLPQLVFFADHLQIALRVFRRAHVHAALLLDGHDLHIAQQLHGFADRFGGNLILRRKLRAPGELFPLRKLPVRDPTGHGDRDPHILREFLIFHRWLPSFFQE